MNTPNSSINVQRKSSTGHAREWWSVLGQLVNEVIN